MHLLHLYEYLTCAGPISEESQTLYVHRVEVPQVGAPDSNDSAGLQQQKQTSASASQPPPIMYRMEKHQDGSKQADASMTMKRHLSAHLIPCPSATSKFQN